MLWKSKVVLKINGGPTWYQQVYVSGELYYQNIIKLIEQTKLKLVIWKCRH